MWFRFSIIGMAALAFLAWHATKIMPENAGASNVADIETPPKTWSLTGSVSLYAGLYESSADALDIELLLHKDIEESDRLITAVAADLVVQYYEKGTIPARTATDTVWEFENDLVVRRTEDIVYLPPEEHRLAIDPSMEAKFPFSEAKQFVRDAVLEQDPFEVCKRLRPWWFHERTPQHLPPAEDYEIPPLQCLGWISEVQEAFSHERELHRLRQDLSLIAYGEEFLWDGQLTSSGHDLRTYDLLLDVIGIGNILGNGSYTNFFSQGSQGEQIDQRKAFADNSCVFTENVPRACGDGVVFGYEQCDDGNRDPGDGCDAFCQRERHYCGDGSDKNSQEFTEFWEECDERKECHDGAICSDFADCNIGGRDCGGDAPYHNCQKNSWRRTCRYTGTPCETNADCEIPGHLLAMGAGARKNWLQNSCRYVADGVCWIGDIIEGSSCTEDSDCSGISSCTTDGYCTNHPFMRCIPGRDEMCFRCRSEDIAGTCYETGELCHYDEECSSGYCMLETKNICRTRTIGGIDNVRSSCNEECSAATRCGDGVLYLDDAGRIEECEEATKCADGLSCYPGGECGDGSACIARDAPEPGPQTCTSECHLQVCGNGRTIRTDAQGNSWEERPEECDDGGKCIRSDGKNTGILCAIGPWGFPCKPHGADGISDPAVPASMLDNETCRTQSEDGCSGSCKDEYCGDGVMQKGLGEECDDGNATNGDGCKASCKREYCGNAITETYTVDIATFFVEACDDGNEISTDDCIACKSAACGDLFVHAGVEECDLGPEGGSLWYLNTIAGPKYCSDSCTITDTPYPIGVAVPTVEPPSVGCVIDGLGLLFCPYCGNGVKNADKGEQCDNGGMCQTSAGVFTVPCVKGVQLFGEPPPPNPCPAGSACVPRSCDGCSNTCQSEGCGNRRTECGEECDDGNTTSEDGCSDSCDKEECGDSVTQGSMGEQCDNGAKCFSNTGWTGQSCDISAPSAPITPLSCPIESVCKPKDCDGCDISCKTIACGNKILQCGEECDDGNTSSNDGCDAQCIIEYCGDGIQQPGIKEECDFGWSNNDVSPDACRTDCKKASCGDGVTDPSLGEECDSAKEPNLGCTVIGDPYGRSPCLLEYCGDGFIDHDGIDDVRFTQDDEQCDDANTDSGDGCSRACAFESKEPKYNILSCGDGWRDNGEECDDGLTCENGKPCYGDGTCSDGSDCRPRSGDGCSFPKCRLENPDLCGNGRVDPGEKCDQMHPMSTMECTPLCQFPQPVPYCGDGEKDPSGAGRGDLLVPLLGFFDGYRLDGRWPAGMLTLSNWSQPNAKKGKAIRSGGGWYVTPRVFDKMLPRIPVSDAGRIDGTDSHASCSRCGNGFMNKGEECDSGRLSNKVFFLERANLSGWQRHIYSLNVQYYDGPELGLWWYDSFRSPARDSCSSSCSLARCGDDRIEYGESCDDGNKWNGDGCSSRCFLEAGFSLFDATIKWPNGTQQAAVCGDGVISMSEQCDHGGVCELANGNLTSRYCRLEPGREFCDKDGPDDKLGTPDDEVKCVPVPGDGCDESCKIEPLAVCGNKKTEPYEECDDGPNGSPSCTPQQCTKIFPPPSNPNAERCGDGIEQRGEECDDGNGVPFDGCTRCLKDLCGNGLLDAGEHCDDGNRLPNDGCSLWCTFENKCGNKEVEGVELCDDGNTWGEDGCSARCIWEYCGDEVTQNGLGEECDDGNKKNDDGCRNDCILPSCGDGVVDEIDDVNFNYDEICDPGLHCSNDPQRACKNPGECPIGPCDMAAGTCAGLPSKLCDEDGDCGFDVCILQDEVDVGGNILCTKECTHPPLCGDGIVNGDEQCDTAHPADTGKCMSDCTVPYPALCGNGVPDAGEQCDPSVPVNGRAGDGNRSGFDGCSPTCQLERMQCPEHCSATSSDSAKSLFVCSMKSVNAGDHCKPGKIAACPGGVCEIRAECAIDCFFGSCGGPKCNADADCGTALSLAGFGGSLGGYGGGKCVEGFCVDPGEQCDDGRHCLNDPKKSCASHSECTAGSCAGADPEKGVSGTCSDEPKRSCMTKDDCRSFCMPVSGDGCSSACMLEDSAKKENISAELTVCIDFVGADQIDVWNKTVLDPHRNPFLQDFWQPKYEEIGKMFRSAPNAIGNLLQMMNGVLKRARNPDRSAIFPFEPTGLGSYAACAEPRAQLTSSVEIPSVPPMSLPQYDPAQAVRDIERGQQSLKETALSNALAIGYTAGDFPLMNILDESVSSLMLSIESALQLFSDLQRAEFTTVQCPYNAAPLCSQ